ncbi:MAG TPA: PilX N-terminal domain-containing pilus assembly protein [Cellvibrionaceae bacterium]|nr:PilX N-terminal domain-containing pilus assembly protein [Cellvibrionaceae bacterium]
MNLLRQSGAALVVSLVILAVVTLIGVAAMQNSSLELKLVASTKDRLTAFQAAEAALALYEDQIKQNPPSLDQLSNNCKDDAECFVNCAQAATNNGFCFQGSYINGQGKASCNLSGNQAFDPVASIKADNYDKNSTKVTAIKTIVGNIQTTPVKMLTEFLCFVEKPDQARGVRIRPDAEENSSYISLDYTNSRLVPLYRITAVADGDAQRSHVVVQTILRLDE